MAATKKSTATNKSVRPKKPVTAKKTPAPKVLKPLAAKKATPARKPTLKTTGLKTMSASTRPTVGATAGAKVKSAPLKTNKPKMAQPKITKPKSTPRISLDEVLGQIVRILSSSPEHRTMALGDLQHRVAPPLRLGQCRVLRGDDGHPLAYAAWARVSDTIHKRLEAGERTLKSEDWNSGPHPWLIDLAAPPKALPQVLAELQKNVFKGERVRTLMERPGR